MSATITETATIGRFSPRSDLRSNANALILGVAITSGLGLLFWAIAARRYSADEVGRNSALIAAMTFIGHVSSLGLRNGLIRYLPAAGAGTARLLRNTHIVCAAGAAVGAIVFLVGQPWWAAELGALRSNVLAALLFVAATAGWVLYIIQESVLTGVRHARWVPALSGSYAVVKLVVLVALAPFTAWGIFTAWSLSAIALLIPVNMLVYRRLLPRRHAESLADGAPASALSLRDVARFAANDHLAGLLWLATAELLPLLVLARAGAAASAYYFLAFAFAYSLYLVTISVGSAYLAEASRFPYNASALLRRAAKQSAVIVVPGAIVGIVAAPVALRILGASYVEFGPTLLQLLLASAVPQLVIGLSVAHNRHLGQSRMVVITYAATAVGVFGGTVTTIGTVGVDAVGWAWLLTQTVIAALLLVKHGVRLTANLPDSSHPADLLARRSSQARERVRDVFRRRQLRSILPTLGDALNDDEAGSYELMRSHNSTLVIGGSTNIGRIALNERGERGLHAHVRALRSLAEDYPLGTEQDLLPQLLLRRKTPLVHTVESRLVGADADQLPPDQRAVAVALAAEAMSAISSHNVTTRAFTKADITHIVTKPISDIASLDWLDGQADDLQTIRSWLGRRLLGTSILLGRTHGDLCLGNVLAQASDRGRIELTGIVDWENSAPDGILDLDLLHLWFSNSGQELGDTVMDALADLDGTEKRFRASTGVDRLNGGLGFDVAVVLTWLHHAAAQLARNSHASTNRLWLARNVVPVVTGVARYARANDAFADPPRPSGRHEALRWSDRLRMSRTSVASIAALVAAIVLWVSGLASVDLDAMNDYGLISVLGWDNVTALALVTASFALTLRRRDTDRWLALHVLVLVVILHATPAVLYDTLRYSWAWKHTGIVEYIMREGRVDTTVAVSPIYHAWPGFFGGSALLTELLGARNAITIATWTPLVLNVGNLVALRSLFRSITHDTRVIWLGIWLYFMTNWVGQDYFAPQGVAFLLYLVLLTVVIRGFATPRDHPLDREPLPRLDRRPAIVLAAVLAVAIVTSHQITPVMVILALGTLTVSRIIRAGTLTVGVAAFTAVWAFTVGRGFMIENGRDVIDEFGSPLASTSENLEGSAHLSDAQRLVALSGRVLVIVVSVLAVVGLVRLWQRHRLDRASAVLLFLPCALIAVTQFGGEVLFRAFLFASPFIAFYAAHAIYPDQVGARLWRRAVAAASVTAVILPCFFLAHFGKDRQYAFSSEEVAAATWLYETAPAGAVIVEGSRNYPSLFLRYEQFTYVPIDQEPTESWEAVLANPAYRLRLWLDQPDAPATYLVLTTSQSIDIDSVGPLPPGSIDDIESALRESNDFRVVYENDDAVILQLAAVGEGG